MITKPMSSKEVAGRVGLSLHRFYRNRQTLHAKGMPKPICDTGKAAYDRAGMEAWLTRNDPRRPPSRAANDLTPPPMPASEADWNAFLHREYASHT